MAGETPTRKAARVCQCFDDERASTTHWFITSASQSLSNDSDAQFPWESAAPRLQVFPLRGGVGGTWFPSPKTRSDFVSAKSANRENRNTPPHEKEQRAFGRIWPQAPILADEVGFE